jgi:O-antigen ligase
MAAQGATIHGAADVELSRLRRNAHLLPVLGLAAWLAYTITGLRAPWQPILVTDANVGSGLRQLLFTAAGLLALRQVVYSRSTAAVLTAQPLAFWLGATVLFSTVYSTNPALTIKRSLILVLLALLLSSVVQAARRPVRQMQVLLVGGTALAAWASLLGSAIFPEACTSIAERPGLCGVTSHPNTAGIVFGLGLAISLGVDPRNGQERSALWVARAGLLVGLVLTNSLTSMIFVVATTVAFLLLSSRPYRRGALMLGLICLASGFGLLTAFVGKAALFQAIGRDPSLSGRDDLWVALLQAGLDRPVFGSGYGAFWTEGRGREIVYTWNPRQAHNAYVDVFLDLGLVGVLAVVGAALSTLGSAMQRVAGEPGSPRRRATSSMVACSLGLLGVYAFGESFLLKGDKLPFVVLLWFLLLLGNRAGNDLVSEFEGTPTKSSQAESRPSISEEQRP